MLSILCQLAYVTRLEFLGVKYTHLILVDQNDEDRVCHEVHLVNLLITAIVAIKFDRLRLVVDVEKLDYLIPGNGHERYSPLALLRSQPVTPVDRGHRLLFADGWPFNRLDRSGWELFHLYYSDHIGRTKGCQTRNIAEW